LEPQPEPTSFGKPVAKTEALPAATHSEPPQEERAPAGSADIAAAEPQGKVPAKAMASIPEEPESEESTEPPPQRPTSKKGTGNAGGKQEAPRSLGKEPADQVKAGGKATKILPGSSGKKAGPEPRKSQKRATPPKAERSISTSDLSEEIRRTDSRGKYLRKRLETSRAARARDAPKGRSREPPKGRQDRSKSRDDYSSSYYSTTSSESASPVPTRKSRRISPSRTRRSRSPSPVRRSESPVYDPRKSRSPRSRSRRKEAPRLTPPAPWTMEGRAAKAGRGKSGRGKGGRGQVATNSWKEGDFHEAYENSGFYRREGPSASYHESNSGCRTEATGHPTQQALEWLEVKARRGAHHNFGNQWNYPKDWPARYWKEGEPCCPPQVLGKAEEYFKEAIGSIFTYLDLDFKFTGQNKEFLCKPHWEPHPYPGRGRGRRGARTGKGSCREPQAEEDLDEEDRMDTGEQEEHKARGWFR
jgi:hypothetical protein